ncbi:hypothetical protein PI124_g22917 [Phytophthora idaei]|nr:hypothetical protein PI125_g24941 [Phytophthora idaei]KAG3125013.1 hypothetical protein PI126_g22970 [Phytophthora idaei]KAG3231996.1 hypothetical protein PI124_g22917 [Phytophthora idaei]
MSKILDAKITPAELCKALGLSSKFEIKKFNNLSSTTRDKLMETINKSDEMSSKFQMLRLYETEWAKVPKLQR